MLLLGLFCNRNGHFTEEKGFGAQRKQSKTKSHAEKRKVERERERERKEGANRASEKKLANIA